MAHPIAPVSFKVNATIAAQRIVTYLTSTANTVKVPAAATELPLGITVDTVLDTTSSIPVAIGGIARLYFNDTIASGRLVASDSSGRGVLHADTTAGSYVVGILIGPTVAATATIAEVLINPFFKSIP
jgi:hypothetical protein